MSAANPRQRKTLHDNLEQIAGTQENLMQGWTRIDTREKGIGVDSSVKFKNEKIGSDFLMLNSKFPIIHWRKIIDIKQNIFKNALSQIKARMVLILSCKLTSDYRKKMMSAVHVIHSKSKFNAC